jgi:hypothetical protein
MSCSAEATSVVDLHWFQLSLRIRIQGFDDLKVKIVKFTAEKSYLLTKIAIYLSLVGLHEGRATPATEAFSPQKRTSSTSIKH